MKTLLPIAPAPASAPAPESGGRELSPENGESFASMLDRQTETAPTPAPARCQHAEEPAAAPPTAEEAQERPDAEQTSEGTAPVAEDLSLDVAALFSAGLALAPQQGPIAVAEAPRLAISLEGELTEDAAVSADLAPASRSATPDGKMEAFRGTVLPTFRSTMDLQFHVAAPAVPGELPPTSPVEFSSLQAIAARGGEELPAYPQSVPVAPMQPRTAAREMTPEIATGAAPAPLEGGEATTLLESAAPFTGLSVVPPGIGTPAAKRGGAMQNAAFPTAEDTQSADSAESLRDVDSTVQVAALGSRPTTPLQRGEVKPESPAPGPMPLRETRLDRGPRDTVAAADLRTAEAVVATPVRATREPLPEAFAPAKEVPEVRSVVAKETELPVQTVPAFGESPVRSEQITTAPTIPTREVTRAEVVQVIERTIDAALRLRASGQERLEVAVQLENGDRLTIQLRLANGEVTPVIRTNSEGLRTALEQNWNQFTDRAGDRGVRLTPPVFDMDRSNSNMSDLSQQRQGRDGAYTEAQAELFPNLPRRMRAPRVLSSTAFESTRAAAEGVRAYA